MLNKTLKRLSFLFGSKNKTPSSPQSEDLYISGEALHSFIQSAPSQPPYQLIDLRTPKEAGKTGIIPGAQLHDYFDLNLDVFLQNLSKEQEYIVYCKVGGRSGKVAQKMRTQGFKIRDYKEGMDGWLNKNYETVPYSSN